MSLFLTLITFPVFYLRLLTLAQIPKKKETLLYQIREKIVHLFTHRNDAVRKKFIIIFRV